MQYNISPDTFVRRDQHFPNIQSIVEGYAVLDSEFTNAANGCRYLLDRPGFLVELMEKMYDDRSMYKKKMIEAEVEYEKTKNPETAKLISRYHNMQLAKKIQLNSAYGALGNNHFRWFDVNHAEAITSSGQLTIQWIIRKLNMFFNRICQTTDYDYVIASDTDSVYISLDKLVSLVYKDNITDTKEVVDFVDKVCKEKIEPFIDKSFQELAEYVSAYKQKMIMKPK
jgi:DNA polymerase elongation subunit (family B)